MEVSPMSNRGNARLQHIRAAIRQKYSNSNYAPPQLSHQQQPHQTHAAQHPRAAHIQNGKLTPQSKVRQRIASATRMSTDEIFMAEFGNTGDDHISTILFRNNAQELQSSQDENSVRFHSTEQRGVAFPTTARSALAPANTTVSNSRIPMPARPSQLVRPTRMRTPRKISLKRGRTGECSAEKRLPLRKPRLLASGDGNSTDTITTCLFQNKSASRHSSYTTSSSKSVTVPSSHASGMSLLRKPSPSKFQFTSNPSTLRQRLLATTRLSGLR